MSGTLIKELDPEHGIDRCDRVIRKLRDEVAAANFQQTRGQNRYWALVVAKLEEAEGLAILAGVDIGKLSVIDRAKILQGVFTDTTDKTDTEEHVPA